MAHVPDQNIFEHKYESGRIVYTVEGIAFYPLLSRHSLTIPWSNIHFISPIPAVELAGNNWQTFDGRSLVGNEYRKLRHFYIRIVLINRLKVTIETSLLKKLLFFVCFPVISATYGADNKQKAYQGFLQYELKLRTLNRPLDELLILIATYSRYDLLCSSD